MRGRQFVQFVGLGYLSWFMRKIEKMAESTSKDSPGKSKEEIKP